MPEGCDVLRIYIAHKYDTLRTIAQKSNIPLEILLSLNPAILESDVNLAGALIRLPPTVTSANRSINIPGCPSLPSESFEDTEWMRLASLEEMQRTEYDVLIVGTGAGGGAVLWRLIQQLGASGKKIGVLERGGLALPTHAQNIETMDAFRLGRYKLSRSTYIQNYAAPQVYAFGGRTLFWGLTSPRMPVSELVKWPIPIEEMTDYYRIAEKIMNVNGNYTKQAYLTQILLYRLQQNGFADAVDEPIAVNLEPINQNGVINSNPFFSSISFFAQSLHAPYDLAVNARVVEVLTEQNKAVGVKVLSPGKNLYFIKAKHIVLAASTFGTTQILLNSGIKGQAIGHFFTNHSRVNSTGKINRLNFPEALGPLRILIPGNKDRPYQNQMTGPDLYSWIQYQIQPLRQEWDYYMSASGEVESRYENRVFLDANERDRDGVPVLKIQFSYSERDGLVIEQMAEAMHLAALAMDAPLLTNDGSFACLAPPGGDSHEMGTCRMGNDPYTSGTNRYGQVHGINGLFVADGSVIPTSGTANITLTIVALAIRTADAIVQQLKS